MEMALSAATGALQPVLGKLATLAGDEYKRLKGIRGEIESLSRELAAMDAFLEKMSAAEDDPDPQDSSWMNEVRELSYDAKDNLDDFMARVTAGDGPDARPDRFMGKIKGLVGRTKARHPIAKAIEDLKRQAVEVDRRALAIFEDASKLVGVDGPKEEVIQLLADDGESKKQPPKVVAIVGSGGLGKTTLANKVYQELKRGFDCDAFFSVSQNPDIVSVMSKIFSQLNKNYSAAAKEDLPTLITKVRDFLTDRNKSGHMYNMRPLDEVHSRQLFYGRLFSSEEKCPSHLKGISSQILEKCAGLPLAIIAISGLLSEKASKKDTWERVKDSIGRALRNASDGVMVNIISLSYWDLPRHLKTCPLYLRIFPEDFTIDKENLIRRWIGEGFIHKQDGCTLHESGEMCFNEPINRSLIQPAKLGKIFGEVKSCRVHDTVLDFIVSKAVEENFLTIIGVPGVNPNPRNKVRRLSLQNGGETPAGLVISSARSLHVFGPNAKIPSLSESRLLRVLDYEDCSQLEDGHLTGIGNLLHLKYLRFNYAGDGLTKLPEQVARLPQLGIDTRDYNKIIEIPSTIWQLEWLSIRDAEVPDEVLAMQGLQVLGRLDVYRKSTEFLVGLGQLKNLRKLSLIFDSVGLEYKDWAVKPAKVVSSIAELSKAGLQSLKIRINGPADEILEDWFPESDPPSAYGLQEFVIVAKGLWGVPTWMASLVNLEKMRLPINHVGEEDVKILGGLPGLRHLHISRLWGRIDPNDDFEAAFERAMEAHPNRPSFTHSTIPRKVDFTEL